MDFHNEHFLTPFQLLKKYDKAPFTHSDLGRLLRMNLLEGVSNRRFTYIDERSFLKLLEFRNDLIANKIIVVAKT